MQTLHLKPGREKSLRRRHPWLFDGAIARAEGDPSDGLCVVRDAAGRLLGSGVVSPAAPLRARLARFDGGAIDEAWIEGRVADALALRRRFVPDETDAFRLLHGEGDLLPGLVVDRYADVLVVQAGSAGTERGLLPRVLPILERELSPATVVFRNDLPTRGGEGLSTETVVAGRPLPDGGVAVRERGLRYLVDPVGGQKTGFFLDQRENRALVRTLAAGRSVLNVFSYTGGFGVAAAAGGARRTVNVDVSAPALAAARRNYAANGLPIADDDLVAADAFEWLRAARRGGGRFDLVVLDPPAFIKSKGALERGLRGYKDVNLQGMPLVEPGGLLVTCSCSGLVDADLFQKVVFGASEDAGIRFRLLERRGAGPDHPVLLDAPETEYLKVLVLQRIE